MPKVRQCQAYGDQQELEVITERVDSVQLVADNSGLIQYIYLDPNDVHRLIEQLQAWEGTV